MELYKADVSEEIGGWERWHDWHAQVMRPVIGWYVRATRAAEGEAILDVACGSGMPALALAERVGPSGRVVAVDFSPKMVAATRRKAAASGLRNVEARVASADAIGGPDAAFAAVTCKDGLMFCPDIVAALREMRRVLAPGGHYAFSAWAAPDANPAFTTLFRLVGEALKLPPPPPDAPSPFRLSAPGELERVVRAAGFSEGTLEQIPITFTFASPEEHWRAFSELAAPLERAATTLPAPEVAQLEQRLAAAIAPFTSAEGVRIPGLQLCISGRR